MRETGAKGCLLVSVEESQLVSAEFRPTDVVRWHWARVTLNEQAGLPELYDAVKQELQKCREASEGRFAAVRLNIGGRCAAHETLLNSGPRAEAIAEIRNLANALDEEVWIEEIRFETSPAVDIEKLRAGGDLLGEMLRHIETVAGICSSWGSASSASATRRIGIC